MPHYRRSVHAPGNDDGTADPRLAQALADWQRQPAAAARAEVLAALADARVFVAITATSTAEHVDQGTGLRAESSAEMAVVSLAAPDGSRALPVFPDPLALRRWRLDVRPVPVDGARACAAAVDDGAVAVVVDPAGAAVVIGAQELASLAGGWVPVPGSSLAVRRTTEALSGTAADAAPELVTALAAALGEEPVSAARLLDGPEGLVLGVVPEAPLEPAALAALAGRVATRMGPLLPPEGLDLAAVREDGPGTPVPLATPRTARRGRRWFRPGR